MRLKLFDRFPAFYVRAFCLRKNIEEYRDSPTCITPGLAIRWSQKALIRLSHGLVQAFKRLVSALARL